MIKCSMELVDIPELNIRPVDPMLESIKNDIISDMLYQGILIELPIEEVIKIKAINTSSELYIIPNDIHVNTGGFGKVMFIRSTRLYKFIREQLNNISESGIIYIPCER